MYQSLQTLNLLSVRALGGGPGAAVLPKEFQTSKDIAQINY